MNYKNLDLDDLATAVAERLKTSLMADENLSLKLSKDLLTPQEVCAIYPCFNDGSLRDATKIGLPYLKIGKHRFYRTKDSDGWLDKQVIIEGN